MADLACSPRRGHSAKREARPPPHPQVASPPPCRWPKPPGCFFRFSGRKAAVYDVGLCGEAGLPHLDPPLGQKESGRGQLLRGGVPGPDCGGAPPALSRAASGCVPCGFEPHTPPGRTGRTGKRTGSCRAGVQCG